MESALGKIEVMFILVVLIFVSIQPVSVTLLLSREAYQKIRSPAPRSEKHFDAGAKFHVPSDYPYIAYFVAHILEFQFYKSLCIAAEQYDPNDPTKPLHKCDFEGSHIAGQRLRDGLSLGLSEHWSKSLSVITDGELEISADAILEYFKPLYEFLIEENKKTPSTFLISDKQKQTIDWFISIKCIYYIVFILYL